MIYLKTEDEIELLRASNLLVAKTLAEVAKYIEPGVSTKRLDEIAEEFIRDHGAIPTFKGYPNQNGEPFPGSICASVNEVVVHGIPSNEIIIQDGDIVSVDTCVYYKGMHTDAARTYLVGNVSEEKRKLVEATENAFFEGIKHIKDGSRVGDIGSQVQSYAESLGYSVVREMQGHGVGYTIHEDPGIPNYGEKGTGPFLKAGMTIAVEPMLNLGRRQVVISRQDGWTCRTCDGSPSAHYENTIVITKDGVEIITL